MRSMRFDMALCAIFAMTIAAGCERVEKADCLTPTCPSPIPTPTPTPGPPGPPGPAGPPGTPGPAVPNPGVTVANVTRELNAQCVATVTLSATVVGLSSTAVTWSLESPRAGITLDPITGAFVATGIGSVGEHRVFAISNSDNNVRGSAIVRILQGTCTGTVTPIPGNVISIDYTPTPFLMQPGQSTTLTASCNAGSIVCPPLTWTSNNASNFSVTPATHPTATLFAVSPGAAEVCVLVTGTNVRRCHTWNAGTAAQVNLSVSPSSLTFQLGGTGCTATGTQFITVSSNQSITISVGNSSMATVGSTSLSSGTHQVAVNAFGNVGGSTTITVTSGGQTQTVTITLTACQSQQPPPPSCVGASSAALPPSGSYARGSSQGFNITAPAGCAWTLTSNNHHVVSVNPSSGTGSGFGSLAFLNSGSATICFVVSGVQQSCRNYSVP